MKKNITRRTALKWVTAGAVVGLTARPGTSICGSGRRNEDDRRMEPHA